MWTVNVILPHGIRFTITLHGVLVAAACLAVALLLGTYVMVLNHSVQRGEQLRAEQRRMATQTHEKAVRNASLSRAVATAQP